MHLSVNGRPVIKDAGRLLSRPIQSDSAFAGSQGVGCYDGSGWSLRVPWMWTRRGMHRLGIGASPVYSTGRKSKSRVLTSEGSQSLDASRHPYGGDEEFWPDLQAHRTASMVGLLMIIRPTAGNSTR